MSRILKKFFGLSLFFLVILGFSFFVRAQEQTNAQVDKFTSCLENRVDEKTGRSIPDSFNLTWHDPPSPSSLTKYLSGSFHPNSTVYAIACRGGDNGRICSTGNKANDDYLFFSDLQTQNTTGQTIVINNNVGQNTDLTKQILVKFYQVGTQTEGSKQQSDDKGTVNYDAVVSGTTATTGSYRFYGIEIMKIKEKDVAIFEETGQHQGTFEFQLPEVAEGNCAKISWTHHDPYGVVFDAKSLEPIPGVIVTILDKDQKKVQFPGFINDLPTGADGLFNYSVQPGNYTLVVTPPKNFKFEDNPPLDQNAQNVYVFTDTNGSLCSLYSPKEVISEVIDTQKELEKKAPDPECRNIALTPLSSPYVAEKVVSMFYDYGKKNDQYTFDGKVSHPLVIVDITQDSKKLAQQRANHSGFYSIKVSSASVLQTAPIEVSFTKANLTALLTMKFPFLKQVFAASPQQIITIDPIFSYIEGYTYDQQNQIIPNAVVKLKLKRTSGTYFQTKSDATGYFSISSNNIPTMEYYLEFTSPKTNKAVTYRTYEFAKKNSVYLKNNQINLITGTKNGVKVTPVASNPANNTEGTDKSISKPNASPSLDKTINRQVKKTASPLVLVIVLIFFVFFIIGIGVFIFIRQKNSQNMPLN
jgi:hypothetical protein